MPPILLCNSLHSNLARTDATRLTPTPCSRAHASRTDASGTDVREARLRLHRGRLVCDPQAGGPPEAAGTADRPAQVHLDPALTAIGGTDQLARVLAVRAQPPVGDGAAVPVRGDDTDQVGRLTA